MSYSAEYVNTFVSRNSFLKFYEDYLIKAPHPRKMLQRQKIGKLRKARRRMSRIKKRERKHCEKRYHS